ncbi:MAG: hypothetical protein K6E13_10075, partial [Lachnospiraceae bacterium]|nr:hypothetical protein [Lachnospiraceae bacterium]
MVKRKLKKITAFVLAFCMVGSLPDYSLMTVYADTSTTVSIDDDDKDVFVAENADKETTDMPNSTTVDFTISDAPDTGAYLAFSDGSESYSDGYVTVDIDNSANTITMTGASRGLVSALTFYVYDTSTSSAISGATDSLDIYVCRCFDSDNVTVTAGSVTYTGSAIVPSFTITDNTESTTLVESSHYTVLSSAANVSDDDGTTYDRTTAGTQKVVIRAVNEGLYYGDYTAEYTISQKDLAEAIAATTTTWSDDGVLEYTGSSIEPTSTDGDAEEYFTISGLTEGTDYEITGYSSNLSVGTATVTLSGLGNYTGTATIDFSIVKDLSSTAISVSFSGIDDTDITYDGAEHILTPTVRNNTDSNTVLEEGTDYTLTYEYESGTSYAYDSATDSYLDGSGNAYDFTNVGTKTAVVTAIGSSYYINSTSLSYSIVSKDIEDCIAVTELPTQVNNSTFLAGTVDGLTITEDGTTSGTALTQDTDYTVTVTVDTDANTADIVVTGINNYTGSYTFSDVAIGIDISTATVTLYSDDGTTDYPYEKGGVEPSFDVTYGTSDLVMGTDYTATFSDNTEIGTATLTIQGAGDYAGTLTQTFEIIEGDLSDDSVTVAMDDDYLIKGTGTIYFNGVYSDDASYAGTGAITPIMSVTQNDTALEENTDFTVTASYSLTSGYASLGDSTQIGTYTVTLTGINNYAGSTWTKNYKVYKTSLDNTTTMSLSLGGTSFAYTGSDIVLTPTSGSTKKITIEQIGSDDNTIELSEDTDYVISYLDSDGDEYTLDSNNTSSTYGEYVNSAGDTYDFASVGTKYIKFTGAGAYCGTTTLSYTISGISIAKGTFSISDKEYTGSEVELDGTEFTATLNGNTLTYGTDFEIVDGTYSNNVDYGNGTASVTVQGIGNYNGTKTVYFYIKKNISDSDITVSYTSSYTYTGEAIEPTVTVEDNGTTLTEDEDYTVSYSNNTDVGTAAEIIITGAGESYTSSRTDYFTITAYTLSDIDDENITYDDTFSYTYDGTEKEPTLSDLSFKFAGSEPTSGTYTLTYTDNVDAGTAYAIFTPNSSSDLSGSVAIPFTIEAKEFDANMTVALGGAYTSTTYTYTGKERKLSKNYITVTDDTLSTELTSGTDFTLSYLNDVDAGSSSVNELYDSTATYSGPIAVITGTGNYSGTWYLGYTINQYDIGTSTFTTVADSTTLYYDGTEKQPSVTVRISSGALTADEDYTITYSDNVNAGTGTYEIDLSTTGNFTDSTTSSTDASYLIVSGSFTIEPRPLSDITIDGLSSKTVSGTTYYYLENQEENDDGSAVIPTLDAYYEISSSSTLDLTLTTDYAVTAYGNNTSVNSNDVAEEDVALNTSDYPYITISGDSGTSGNYTGDLTLYFNIRQGISADWADSWEWADNAVLSYSTLSGYSTIYAADNDMKVMSFTGQVIEPDVTVTYGGTTTELTLNEDYTLVYDDDINCKDSSGNVIEHTATITGIGDYGGSETLSFYIFPLTLPTEAAIASTSYDSSTMYKTYDGYPCNYFTIEGTSVSFIGASSVDVTDMFGTTILFYPNGDALTNSGSAETYDVVSNGNIENFTADLSSSSGTVSASTGLKDAMVHNFKLPTASAYTVTLSIGARSLGDTSSYESYISVDDIDSQIYTGEHISLSGEVNVYDKYRTSTGTYNTTSRTSDFYELEEGTDYVLYYSETAESASAVQEVGTNTIYIVGTGDYTGTISKTYTVVSSIATGSVSIEESTYSGEEQSPAMIVTVNGEVLTADTDYTYEVFDGTTSMGTTATDAGDYTVVITGIGDYETNSSTTLSRTWTIGTLGIDTSDISIRNISSSYTYDGSTVYQPVPIVYFGSTLLTVNTDYTLTYSVTSLDDTSGTEYVSPGTYTVEVAGMGNFGASKTYTYVIGDNFIEGTDDDEIVVTIDNTTLTYDSTDRTDDFGITVALGDGTELTLGTDYEYQILDTDGNLPINAGDYTVYISGLNSYAGLIEKSVTIDPEDITALTLSDVEDEFTYDGTEKEPTPDVTWNGSDATSLIGTDFNYYYYNNVDATEALSLATVTLVPSSNGNFTADNGDFTPVTFEIAPRSITDNDDIEITVTTNSSGNVYLQYSGTTPGVTVVDNGITVSGSAYTMVASTDYTVAFSNNTTVSTTDSTAVVTVTGTGNYTGEKSTTFYIEKYPMSDTTVSCTDGDSFSFTGYEIEPDLTVTDEDGTALVLDQDYTVEYTDNVDVGQATATLTATDDG